MARKKQSRQKPVEAKPEQYFVLATGVPLKNLKELASALENMNDWVFRHHVNDHRNDFATWVRDVLREDELSQEMYSLHNNKDMEIRIIRHLVYKYL